MSKAKQQQKKKKERERRVAQEKHAAVQKRTQDQAAKDSQAAGVKTNKLAAAVPVHKIDTSANVKSNFIRRRGVS